MTQPELVAVIAAILIAGREELTVKTATKVAIDLLAECDAGWDARFGGYEPPAEAAKPEA